jgi:hypothetical protein
MPLTIAAKNGCLDGAPLRQRITHLSIHTAAAPAGGSEVSGSGYARVAITSADWGAAAAGEIVLNNDKNFDGPANGSASHFGIWAGTTFLGDGANTGGTTFNSEGKFRIKAGTKVHLNL